MNNTRGDLNAPTRGEFIRRASAMASALTRVGYDMTRRDYIREAKVLMTGRSPSDRGNERASITHMIRVDRDLPGCFGVGHNLIQIPHDGRLVARPTNELMVA